MEHRGLQARDLVEMTGADKSNVSRWLNKGALPKGEHLLALADGLEAESIASLFRHPDDDWMARLFQQKQLEAEERERAKAIIDAAFPDKAIGG